MLLATELLEPHDSGTKDKLCIAVLQHLSPQALAINHRSFLLPHLWHEKHVTAIDLHVEVVCIHRDISVWGANHTAASVHGKEMYCTGEEGRLYKVYFDYPARHSFHISMYSTF